MTNIFFVHIQISSRFVFRILYSTLILTIFLVLRRWVYKRSLLEIKRLGWVLVGISLFDHSLASTDANENQQYSLANEDGQVWYPEVEQHAQRTTSAQQGLQKTCQAIVDQGITPGILCLHIHDLRDD